MSELVATLEGRNAQVPGRLSALQAIVAIAVVTSVTVGHLFGDVGGAELVAVLSGIGGYVLGAQAVSHGANGAIDRLERIVTAQVSAQAELARTMGPRA